MRALLHAVCCGHISECDYNIFPRHTMKESCQVPFAKTQQVHLSSTILYAESPKQVALKTNFLKSLVGPNLNLNSRSTTLAAGALPIGQLAFSNINKNMTNLKLMTRNFYISSNGVNFYTYT